MALLGSVPTGFYCARPPLGRVLRNGDRVVTATTRRGLDFLTTDVQPHPPNRRDASRQR